MMDSAKGMMGMKPKTQNVVVKGIPVEFGPGNLGFTLAEDSKIGGSFAQRFSLGRRRNKMTLFVVEVADGGQASLAGVEPGMRVVAINGTKLEAGTDVDTFVLAVLHARGGLNSERNVTITFEPVPQAAGSNRQADVHVVTHPPMNPADDEDGPNVFKVEYDDGDA
jgi:predicted metalloprotease with PDZ domain